MPDARQVATALDVHYTTRLAHCFLKVRQNLGNLNSKRAEEDLPRPRGRQAFQVSNWREDRPLVVRRNRGVLVFITQDWWWRADEALPVQDKWSRHP